MNWNKAWVTRESLRLFARAALTSLAYFISARLGVALLFQPQSIASFWPPSGLLVGVLARSRRRTWPMILLAIIPANIVANLLAGKPLAASCGFALVNCVANVIGVWLLAHFIGPDIRLTQMREVLRLIAVPGIISTALSATLAAVVVTQGMGISSFWGVWYAWWAADALGILLIGPMILTWPADGAIVRHTFRPHRLAEIALLFAGMMSVAGFVFREEPLPTSLLLPLPYLTFPFLLWAAVRFGPRTTSAASLVLALLAVCYTAQGHGPFAVTGESVGDHVFSAQVFLSVSIITSLILAASLAGRRRAEEALRTSEDRHRLLFERNLAGTFHSRRDGLMLECNDGFVHLLGYTSRAEVLAHNARDFYWDAQERAQLLTQLRPGFIINNYEMQWRRADGRPIWVMVNATMSPILDTAGVLLGSASIARDVSERKWAKETFIRRTEELDQANAELARSNKELDDLPTSPLMTSPMAMTPWTFYSDVAPTAIRHKHRPQASFCRISICPEPTGAKRWRRLIENNISAKPPPSSSPPRRTSGTSRVAMPLVRTATSRSLSWIWRVLCRRSNGPRTTGSRS